MTEITTSSFAQIYRNMSAEDRAALKVLQESEQVRYNKKVAEGKVPAKILSTREVLEAVSPGCPDPAYLAAIA